MFPETYKNETPEQIRQHDLEDSKLTRLWIREMMKPPSEAESILFGGRSTLGRIATEATRD